MICVAALNRGELKPVIAKIRSAKPYFQPNRTMLRLADKIIQPSPGLVDIANSGVMRDAVEDVGLTAIALADD